MNRFISATPAVLLTVAVAATLAHTVRTIHLLGGPANILSSQPVLSGDYGLHAYYCLVRKTSGSTGSLFGYDPFFMAGYPHTLAFPMSSVFFELLTWPLPEHAVWPALKLSILASAAFPPILLGLATWLADGRSATGLVAYLLALSVFWSAQPEVFLRTGLASWLLSSVLAVGTILAGAAALASTQLRRSALLTALTLALAALSVVCHFLQCVTLAIAWIVLGCLWGWRQPRRYFGLSLVTATMLAGFTYPLWRSLPDALQWVASPGVFFVPERPISDAINLVLTGGHHQWIILWMALASFVSALRAPVAARHTAAVGVVVLAFALTGSLVPGGSNLQPQRFQTPALWLLVPAASAAITCVAERLQATAQTAVLASVATLLFVRLIAPGFASVAQPRERLSIPITRGQRALINWLRTRTTDSHRVLFEDVSARDMEAELARAVLASPEPAALRHRIGPLLPVLTRRCFIGGLYYPAYLQHSAVKFGNARLLGRPLIEDGRPTFSPQEIKELFDRYNVGWVVAWSPPARRFFDSLPRVARRVLEVGPYVVYEVVQPGRGYCLRGHARVQFAWNRIELRCVVPDSDGRLVLKCHWAPQLTVTTPESAHVTCHPWTDRGMPVPFIELQFHGPPPEVVTIRADY